MASTVRPLCDELRRASTPPASSVPPDRMRADSCFVHESTLYITCGGYAKCGASSHRANSDTSSTQARNKATESDATRWRSDSCMS
eukprot:6211204-Pleurochrysis_carterae.AAC.2